MTSWNILNMLDQNQQRGASDPTSAFDPSQTGDPISRDFDRPAIGFGDTRVGGPAQVGDSQRRPIGFAPPADETPEPRYQTELSFKRHHEAPRASATAEPPDGPDEPWQTPGPEQGDALLGSDSAPEFFDLDPVEADSAIDADVVVEERIPFYKREISFRRKRAVSDETPETAVVGEDEASEIAAQIDERDGLAEADESSDDEPAETSDLDAAPAGAEVMASADAADDDEALADEWPAEADPGLDPVAEAEPSEHEEDLELFPDDGPEITAAVAGAEVVATSEPTEVIAEDSDDLADGADDLAAAALPLEEAEALEDVHALEDDMPLETDALELMDEEPAEPLASDPSVDEPELESPSGEDDLFIEDTPPPAKGRRSRKDKRGDKSPDKGTKRKPARGGKGRQVVGLKIGASQIAAAVVAETESGHELVELARRPLAAGIVVDGEIRDMDALTNVLKAFFDEEKLPRKDVRIGLASNRIGVRTFDIVGIDDEARFDNAVRFKAHEVLPVAAHESVLDYRVLEARPNEAGEPSRRVLLVVAPRDQVAPYAEVANRVGLKLTGIDLEALGLLRAFVEPQPFAVRAVDDTATVVVSIGHESSTLLVAGGGACEFTRVFDWGGSALEEAIATELEVHPAEAATILRHLSLSGPGRKFEALDDVARARALDAVRLRLTPFARELVSSLQFYQTQTESLGIGGIVITGGTSHLEGLGDALHQMIGVNVTVGDPLARVVRSAEFDPAIEAVIGSMAVPIGLAIDDISMRCVNLLPKDAVPTKSKRANLIAIGAPIAVAVPLVALGVLYLGAHGKAADNQTELDAVKAEIAALPEPQGPNIDASVVGDEAVRATAVASVLGGRLAWDAVFRDLARVLPTNVWLKSLSASLPTGTTLADGTTAAVVASTPGQADPAPTAVVIEGYTYTQPDVARLLARLATLPSLKRVTLTSSGQELVGKKEVVRFVIVADLSQTGGAS